MNRICFLSMDSLDGYVADDDLAIKPLNHLGWQVDTVSWRNTSAVWDDYQAVIIRTPWDYQGEPEAFLSVLDMIDSSPARLANPLAVVRWNLNKRYLRGMEQRGCRIVPTIWDAAYSAAEFDKWCDVLGSDKLIVKPAVSATAEHTYLLTSYDASLDAVFDSRRFLVQAFMPMIVTEGEYSLFYFGGEYSHAINKAPKPTDFRVQEEHGGIITAVEPEPKMLDAGRAALDQIGGELLYARVDFVRDETGNFALMELELIEPALYLRMDEGAPTRFAEAIDRMMN